MTLNKCFCKSNSPSKANAYSRLYTRLEGFTCTVRIAECLQSSNIEKGIQVVRLLFHRHTNGENHFSPDIARHVQLGLYVVAVKKINKRLTGTYSLLSQQQ